MRALLPRPVPVQAPAGVSVPTVETTDAATTIADTAIAPPTAPADTASPAADAPETPGTLVAASSKKELWANCRAAWAHQGLVVAQADFEEAGSINSGSSNGERTAVAWMLTLNELRFGVGLVGAEQGAASATALVPRAPDLCCALVAHRCLHAYAVAFLPGASPSRKTSALFDGGRRRRNRAFASGAEAAPWQSCLDLPLWVLPSNDSGNGSHTSGSTTLNAGNSTFVASSESSSDDEENIGVTHKITESLRASATTQTKASSSARLAALGGVLCPFELHGTCNDSDCKFQHLRSFTAALNATTQGAAEDATIEQTGNGANDAKVRSEGRARALMSTSDDQEAFPSPFAVPSAWQVRELPSPCGAALDGVPLESDAVERWLPLLGNLNPALAGAPNESDASPLTAEGALLTAGTASKTSVEGSADMVSSSDDGDADDERGPLNSPKRVLDTSIISNKAHKYSRSDGIEPKVVSNHHRDRFHGSDNESFMAFGDSSGLTRANANLDNDKGSGSEGGDLDPNQSDAPLRYWVDKGRQSEDATEDNDNSTYQLKTTTQSNNNDDMTEIHERGPIVDAMRTLGVHAVTASLLWAETIDPVASRPLDGLPRFLARAVVPKSALVSTANTDLPIQQAVEALAHSIEMSPQKSSGYKTLSQPSTDMLATQLLHFRLSILVPGANTKTRIDMAFDVLCSAPQSVLFAALAVSECYGALSYRLSENTFNNLSSNGEHACTFRRLMSLLATAAKITHEALDTNRGSSYAAKSGPSSLLIYLSLAQALVAGGYPEVAASFLDTTVPYHAPEVLHFQRFN